MTGFIGSGAPALLKNGSSKSLARGYVDEGALELASEPSGVHAAFEVEQRVFVDGTLALDKDTRSALKLCSQGPSSPRRSGSLQILRCALAL